MEKVHFSLTTQIGCAEIMYLCKETNKIMQICQQTKTLLSDIRR